MMRWQPSDGIHLVFLLLYEVVVDVLLVWHELVNRAAGCEFDDTVAYGLNELVVVAGEQNVALEGDKVVVQCLDRLQVEMVGRMRQFAFCNCMRAIIRRIFSPPESTFTFFSTSSWRKSMRPR